MTVLEDEDNLTPADFLSVVSEHKSTKTSDDLEGIIQDQIKEDIRQHQWTSLADCGSSISALKIVLDLMRSFVEPTKSTLSLDLLNDASLEQKRGKYLYGMICWCARLMNILNKLDTIEDNEQIENCYRVAVANFIPKELIVNRPESTASPGKQPATRETSALRLVDSIRQAQGDIRERKNTVYQMVMKNVGDMQRSISELQSDSSANLNNSLYTSPNKSIQSKSIEEMRLLGKKSSAVNLPIQTQLS